MAHKQEQPNDRKVGEVSVYTCDSYAALPSPEDQKSIADCWLHLIPRRWKSVTRMSMVYAHDHCVVCGDKKGAFHEWTRFSWWSGDRMGLGFYQCLSAPEPLRDLAMDYWHMSENRIYYPAPLVGQNVRIPLAPPLAEPPASGVAPQTMVLEHKEGSGDMRVWTVTEHTLMLYRRTYQKLMLYLEGATNAQGDPSVVFRIDMDAFLRLNPKLTVDSLFPSALVEMVLAEKEENFPGFHQLLKAMTAQKHKKRKGLI